MSAVWACLFAHRWLIVFLVLTITALSSIIVHTKQKDKDSWAVMPDDLIYYDVPLARLVSILREETVSPIKEIWCLRVLEGNCHPLCIIRQKGTVTAGKLIIEPSPIPSAACVPENL